VKAHDEICCHSIQKKNFNVLAVVDKIVIVVIVGDSASRI